MHSGSTKSVSPAMLCAQLILEAARGLPCDHVTRLQLLFALLDTTGAPAGVGGVSVAVLADRASLPLELARHAVRALRVDGHVCLAGRIGKTDFFKLAPTTEQKLTACLNDLDRACAATGEARSAHGGSGASVRAVR